MWTAIGRQRKETKMGREMVNLEERDRKRGVKRNLGRAERK